jgi:PAS domain S-box-containing protein
MAFFWLTVALGALIFALPRSSRISLALLAVFVASAASVCLGHRLFPAEGYHPWRFILLMIATDVMIAVLVYFTAGSTSVFALLYMAVIIFAAAYLDIAHTLVATAVTAVCFLLPLAYEDASWLSVRNMAAGLPVFVLVALSATLLIKMAREQQSEKEDLSRVLGERHREALAGMGRLEAILDSLHDGLGVIDARFHLVMANPRFRELLGISEGDLGGLLPAFLERNGDQLEGAAAVIEEVRGAVLEKGETLSREITLGKESLSYFQLICMPLQQRGEVAGAVLVARDITEFRKLDQLKSHFISIVSHELKTPLTSIRGFASLLIAERFGPLNDKQQHHLQIVRDQAESLSELINSLLDLSRIESGMLRLQREPVALERLLHACLIQFEDDAEQMGVRLETDIQEDLPPLFADRRYLAQVISNLVSNALKFSEGGGRVAIQARGAGAHCLMSVSDEGPGIAPQDLARIFDRFYQADSTDSRRQNGTGLGLTIAREFVRAHGGDIWAESETGKGATFFVALPLFEPRRASPRYRERLTLVHKRVG